MTSLVWLNIPLAVLVILAIVGIPMWLTFKRPEQGPDYADARAHFRTKGARARGQAVTVGGHVLAGPERPRLHPGTISTVPGRRHSGARSAARSHVPGAEQRTRASG
jgi:hypothetical protein